MNTATGMSLVTSNILLTSTLTNNSLEKASGMTVLACVIIWFIIIGILIYKTNQLYK